MSAKAVAVFLSSSSAVDEQYRRLASDIGRGIARRGWTLVWGGTTAGLMGVLGDAAREAGGRTVGVIPQRLVDVGIAYEKADELIVTADMRARKALMDERADAFLVLPGGIGTLEEALEVVTLRQLGFHEKPIVFLNTGGWFNPLDAMVDRMVEAQFAKASLKDAWRMAANAEEAMEILAQWAPEPMETKWFKETDAEIS